MAVALAAAAAFAQAADPNESSEEMARQAEAAKPLADEIGFVVLPIPQANPTLGDGLTLAGVLLYNPTGGARPWISGVGAMYTDTDSKAWALFQKAYLMEDRLRLTGAAGAFDFNLRFYGVGSDAGNRNSSVPMNQQGDALFVKGLYEIGGKLYAGAALRYVALATTFQGPTLPSLGVTLPAVELDAVSSALGLVAEYDTRDSELNPQRGAFATVSAYFMREAFGSDFEYEHATVSYNHYLPLAPSQVLAMRGKLCGVSGDAPFFDLCFFGGGADLRGYVGGRYRDKAMLAAQVEYRWNFHGRWGMVVFAGAGSVAPSGSELLHSTTLPSYGAGLRFIASKAYKVNIAMDFAHGRDDSAFYFRIGEAF